MISVDCNERCLKREGGLVRFDGRQVRCKRQTVKLEQDSSCETQSDDRSCSHALLCASPIINGGALYCLLTQPGFHRSLYGLIKTKISLVR